MKLEFISDWCGNKYININNMKSLASFILEAKTFPYLIDGVKAFEKAFEKWKEYSKDNFKEKFNTMSTYNNLIDDIIEKRGHELEGIIKKGEFAQWMDDIFDYMPTVPDYNELTKYRKFWRKNSYKFFAF